MPTKSQQPSTDSQSPIVAAIDTATIHSLDERVRKIQRALDVARAIVPGLRHRSVRKNLEQAAEKLLTEIEDQVYWIGNLPDFMLALPIPTDDDVSNRDGNQDENHERFWLSYMRDTFRVPTSGGAK